MNRMSFYLQNINIAGDAIEVRGFSEWYVPLFIFPSLSLTVTLCLYEKSCSRRDEKRTCKIGTDHTSSLTIAIKYYQDIYQCDQPNNSTLENFTTIRKAARNARIFCGLSFLSKNCVQWYSIISYVLIMKMENTVADRSKFLKTIVRCRSGIWKNKNHGA